MKLYVAPPSPRAFKVLAVAKHLGLDYELVPLDLRKGDQAQPHYAAMNPNRKMPVLEDDGFVLWESNAILQYLADKRPSSGLLPTDSRARADVSRWQFWDVAHWDPACAVFVFERVVKQVFGLGAEDPAEITKAEPNFDRYAGVLDGHLKGRRFLAGDQLTIADFGIGAWMNYAAPARYPLENYQAVRRWHADLMELPAWRSSIVAPPAPA